MPKTLKTFLVSLALSKVSVSLLAHLLVLTADVTLRVICRTPEVQTVNQSINQSINQSNNQSMFICPIQYLYNSVNYLIYN